jgi:hypothetical protein
MGSILNLLKIRVKNLCDDCVYIHVNPPTSNERREKQYKDKNASDICVCDTPTYYFEIQMLNNTYLVTG